MRLHAIWRSFRVYCHLLCFGVSGFPFLRIPVPYNVFRKIEKVLFFIFLLFNISRKWKTYIYPFGTVNVSRYNWNSLKQSLKTFCRNSTNWQLLIRLKTNIIIRKSSLKFQVEISNISSNLKPQSTNQVPLKTSLEQNEFQVLMTLLFVLT